MRRSALAVMLALGACGGESAGSATSGAATADTLTGDGRCVVRLHGKGGDGAPSTLDDGVVVVAPRGNDEGWGGRQWLYFPAPRYEEARAVVAAAIDAAACSRVVVHGFSNGGAFAAKLFCAGETFDGRVVGYVVDDPVTDASAQGCAAAPGVDVALYWTGALADQAQPGQDCGDIDWTCEGGTVTDVGDYAAQLGAQITPSPFDGHEWYVDAPEVGVWLA